MAISKATLQDRLRPFIQTHVHKEVIDLLTDEEFLSMFNEVARDLNQAAFVHVTRFYKKTNSTNAEDDDLTNYLTARPIVDVYSFLYEDSGAPDQVWTHVYRDASGNGRIVLKTAPTTEIQLDIWYLGDTLDITDASDEIDLPENLTADYAELLRKKILSEYTDQVGEYEKWLEYYGQKAGMKMNRDILKTGYRRSWLGMSGDDSVYEIIKQKVSAADNITAGGDGNYTFYT